MSAAIVCADAGRLPLRERSVDCVVTSPPYNAGMPYRGIHDALPLGDYIVLVARWAQEIARVLCSGGRVWVNVPQALPLLTGSQRWSPARTWHHALEEVGLLFRDWIVWHQAGADAAKAWGSYLSPNAPNIRGRFELILLFPRNVGVAAEGSATTSLSASGGSGRATFGRCRA